MKAELKDVYGALNATSQEIGDVMEYLMRDGSGEALRFWGRLEQLKFECEGARDFMLTNRVKLETAL